jgi:hypothetical protein
MQSLLFGLLKFNGALKNRGLNFRLGPRFFVTCTGEYLLL